MSLSRVTVLIGVNNSGKTSLIMALNLALGNYARHLSEEDFYIDNNDKRVKEILVDLRIISIDGNGKRQHSFSEDWQVEFGDKIQSDINGYQ